MTSNAESRSPHIATATQLADRRCPRQPSQSTQRPVPSYLRRLPDEQGSAGPPAGSARTARMPASRPGTIGGAVIRTARRSAGLNTYQLARAAGISTGIIRAWENGTIALFCVSYHQLSLLASALNRAGATAGRDVRDLVLASQCDLLLTGMLHGFEDCAEVPPIEEDSADAAACRELLRWAVTGRIPALYRPYTSAQGPLLSEDDINTVMAIARKLQAGELGQELISYGIALLELPCH